MTEYARYGWDSDFLRFSDAAPKVVRATLQEFIADASKEQVRAWDDEIPKLQREVRETISCSYGARTYEVILEYELPMESRRTDAILLVSGAIIVLEFKGKLTAAQADIDQASAYARDLRGYHRECQCTPVYPAVIPTLASGRIANAGGVEIMGPDAIDCFVREVEKKASVEPVSAQAFLAAEAYRPLPTLVQAARELFQSQKIRPIHRARAATEPAVSEITRIIHEAARTKSRHLVLLTGVPGAGKTLVGLQAVHAHYLDDLAVPRADGRPTTPAVFLSGNGPLVDVLQYEFRGAGGGGRVFVRGVKDYVKRYSQRPGLVPPEHVLVFDEAQRAFDAEQVQKKHSTTPGFEGGKSEPEHFVEFAERIPKWCVVIGLIGGGQEIHVGEEAGLIQWRHAVEGCKSPRDWTVHASPPAADCFKGSKLSVQTAGVLNLDMEIRFHLASDLHNFVSSVLDSRPATENAAIADKLEACGYHLRITRDIRIAKEYLRSRYSEHKEARFGLLASSKDRDLVRFGVFNDFQTTKRVRFGPWYGDDEDTSGEHSCRHLRDCVTEFGAQGLELDASLVAWGTDLKQVNQRWSNARARGYMADAHVKDPFQLRLNAYRVLLTRGRDATVVYVPALDELDETFEYLVQSGFARLL